MWPHADGADEQMVAMVFGADGRVEGWQAAAAGAAASALAQLITTPVCILIPFTSRFKQADALG
jgi:hypothetical protein